MGNIEFRQWFWEKFEAWRKGTTNGPTAFARYLGVPQQYVTLWLNGKGKPGVKQISKIAEKYPDVYEALGIEPVGPILPAESLPPEFRTRLQSALDEIERTIVQEGLDRESERAEQVAISVMERFGFKYIETSND